jgi:hypothetical protein
MKKYLGLITGLMPFIAAAQLIMPNSTYLVIAGGPYVNPTSFALTNPVLTGITNSLNLLLNKQK